MSVVDYPFCGVLDDELALMAFLIFNPKNKEERIFSVHSNWRKKTLPRRHTLFLLSQVSQAPENFQLAYEAEDCASYVTGRLSASPLLDVVCELVAGGDFRVEGDQLVLRIVYGIVLGTGEFNAGLLKEFESILQGETKGSNADDFIGRATERAWSIVDDWLDVAGLLTTEDEAALLRQFCGRIIHSALSGRDMEFLLSNQRAGGKFQDGLYLLDNYGSSGTVES